MFVGWVFATGPDGIGHWVAVTKAHERRACIVRLALEADVLKIPDWATVITTCRVRFVGGAVNQILAQIEILDPADERDPRPQTQRFPNELAARARLRSCAAYGGEPENAHKRVARAAKAHPDPAAAA
jgi:hypothetical protein